MIQILTIWAVSRFAPSDDDNWWMVGWTLLIGGLAIMAWSLFA